MTRGSRIFAVPRLAVGLVFLATPAVADPAPVLQSLTIDGCIERALEHNLDLRIERLNPRRTRWNILREQAAFEPALTASATYQDSSEPLDPERNQATGVSDSETETLRLRTGLEGTLPSGTAYRLDAFNNRSEGTFAPDTVHVGNVALTLTQPLLRDFWFGPNTASLRVARKDRQVALETFAAQVIDIVTATENAYYELVFAIEDHQARQQDLAEAEALLADNRKRLEVGVLSSLDVVQAEAGVAEREEAVIITARAIRDRENDLKRLISDNLLEFRGVRFLPEPNPPVAPVVLDVDSSLLTALELRPEYRRARHEIERRGIEVAFNRNQLWPEVDLEASYGLNGRGGSFDQLADDVGSTDNPVWTVGVVVRVPLGNRRARADYQGALLDEERALLELKRLEQEIVVEIDNAVGSVITNRKRIEATAAAVRLAEESLRAERERLQNGLSTSLLVLQAQSALADARAAAIRARTDYDKSLVELARAEGTVLRRHGIVLEE